MIDSIKQLNDAGIIVKDVCVILNRLEGAEKALSLEGIKLYQLTDIMQITKSLHESNLINNQILEKIQIQISKK